MAAAAAPAPETFSRAGRSLTRARMCFRAGNGRLHVSDSKRGGSGGVGLPTVLFIVFLVLKLTDHIDWSWWWVTSPLWIPFALFVPLVALFVACYGVGQLVRR